MKSKSELIESVTGNQISGRDANRFFELRGYANRHANQGNVGPCMLWNVLKKAAENNPHLMAEISAVEKGQQ